MATNLDLLITEVLISPTSPNWLPKVIEDVIQKYGYRFSAR